MITTSQVTTATFQLRSKNHMGIWQVANIGTQFNHCNRCQSCGWETTADKVEAIEREIEVVLSHTP